MRVLKYMVLVSVLTGVLLGLAAGAGAATVQEIKDRGVLRVAAEEEDLEPFDFVQDGVRVGLEVDLVQMVADKLGVKAEFVRVPWDNGVTLCWDPAYPWDKFDMAASSISMNSARAEVCDFSEWYVTTGQMILVRADSGYKSLEDLKDKKIACLAGSTIEDVTKANFPAENALALPTYDAMIDAVRSKKADAAVYDGPQIILLAKKDPTFVVLEDLLAKDRYGVALPKGSDLKAVVDEVILEHRKALYDKWMK